MHLYQWLLTFWGTHSPFESLIKAMHFLPRKCVYAPDLALSFEVRKYICENGNTTQRMVGLCKLL